MNWRTLLLLVGALALMAGAFWIGVRNEDVLSQELVLFFRLPGQEGPASLPVGHGLLASAALGALAVGAAWGATRMRAAVTGVGRRRAARAEREVEASYQRGLEALLDGRHDRALELMQGVLARLPDHAGAASTAADLSRARGRVADAIALRERRLAEHPDDAATLYALAEDHRAAGDLDRAATALRRVLELRPRRGIAAAEQLREVLVEAEQWEQAIEANERLQRMRGGPGDDPHVRAGLETRWALQRAREGHPREATALLKKVLRRDEAYLPASLAAAEVLNLDGREDEALETWLEAFRRTGDPTVLVAAEQHHAARRRDGDDIERANKALTALRRLVAAVPESAHAKAFLGKLYLRFEMLDEAAAAFDSVRAEFPDHPTFTYYAARIAEKQGRFEEAARWYRGIVKALDVLRLRYACGSCHADTGALADRCPACHRWGSVGLAPEAPPLAQDLPAAHPVYPVPGESSEAGRDVRGATG